MKNNIIYLYVKQQEITGLKYFGMTTRNPFEYRGSGKYWLRHIRKYGLYNIKTLNVWGFDDINLCKDFALKFSVENNIVDSMEWANLISENALPGMPKGFKHKESSKNKMSKSKKGYKRPEHIKEKYLEANKKNSIRMKENNPMKNPEIAKKVSESKKGHKPVITIERNKKISKSKKGIKNHNFGKPETAKHMLVKGKCRYCGKETVLGNLARWHNENCKTKI